MPSPVEFLDGLIHEPSQVDDDGVSLTAGQVYRITEAGQADFGGEEYADPATEPVDTERRDAADEYGWWELDAGTYLLAFNESLQSANVSFVLQPHERLLALGASHPTAHVTDVGPVPLSVPEAGVALKENAQVSRLVDTD
ncbi:dCTP deaminase [Halorarius halobius]|uniref:dCTP deaminase n=1 Tax=Halorarius halobius TaxID=2962671 RepID=UPI0020CBE6C6|nr:dCTP deaminase [Halorarius halobius]